MASTRSSVPQGLCSLVLPGRRGTRAEASTRSRSAVALRRCGLRARCAASTASSSSQEGPKRRQRAPPGVDTRIHWENEDEGWLGVTDAATEEVGDESNLLGEKFADLLNESTDSHYQFLGVSADADMEEIKSAYRRLSKEYHPDTTSLPLKEASNKFLRLREVYNVLSNDESRRFYDWTLAQEAASRQAEKMRMRLQDPYEQEIENYVPVPDVIDRLGGRNMDLSDQAMSALTIDVLIVIFSICCIIYVALFKET